MGGDGRHGPVNRTLYLHLFYRGARTDLPGLFGFRCRIGTKGYCRDPWAYLRVERE